MAVKGRTELELRGLQNTNAEPNSGDLLDRRSQPRCVGRANHLASIWGLIGGSLLVAWYELSDRTWSRLTDTYPAP